MAARVTQVFVEILIDLADQIPAANTMGIGVTASASKVVHATAVTGLGLGVTATTNKIVNAEAVTGLGLAGVDDQVGDFRVASADQDVILAVLASELTTLSVGASSPIGFTSFSSSKSNPRRVSAISAFSLSQSVSRPFNAVASNDFLLSVSASGGVDVYASAVTGLGIGTALNQNQQAASGIGFGVEATGLADQRATSRFSIGSTVDATIVAAQPEWGPVSDSSASTGLDTLRRSIYTDISRRFPFTYAETPEGDILMANGVGPVLKWRWFRDSAEEAGIAGPTVAPTMGKSGNGTIAGTYYSFVRFVGRDGNVSNLSPVSNEVIAGTSGGVSALTRSLPTGGTTTDLATATELLVTSAGHGLANGATVFFQEIPDTVIGLDGDQGYTISGVTDDTFKVAVSAVSGSYGAGGMSWVSGSTSITYSGIPTTSDPRITKRQILRSTAGSYRTFYVDVELTDSSATTANSTKSDTDLIAAEGVPLFYGDDRPFASRHHVPPSHKSSIAVHLGRAFLGAEVDYTYGHAVGSLGSETVTGVGTRWRDNFAGRRFYIDGDPNPYVIESVDEDAQEITLTEGLKRPPSAAATYAIRPDSIERRLVYFSEAGLYESWPPYNAFSVQEDGDEIAGLMSLGAWLFIICRHHIYRFTYQDSPNDDGAVFQSSHRGCVNARCWAVADGTAFMIDGSGAHAFDGGESTSISEPIQDVFRPGRGPGLRINWNADQSLWHAAHDPTNDTIRWFVSMSGHREPRHALCYDYRRTRWWIEEYPFVVTSSTVASLGSRRSFAGTAARQVLWIGGDSHSEIATEAASVRGTVASSSPLSLTATESVFASSLVGSPVSIVSGKGSGQQRTIVDVPAADRVKVDRPWLDSPDDTSAFQVGGVDYKFTGHWYRFVDDQESRTRNVELLFSPLRSTTAEADMRLYYDFGDQAHEWKYTDTRYGAAVEEGSTSILIDLTRSNGIAVFHHEGHRDSDVDGHRFVSVEIAGTQGPERIRFRQLRLHGVE